MGGRRLVGGTRGRDVSSLRDGDGEVAVEGRFFCSRLGDGLSSGDPKVKVPDPRKLIRLVPEEEVERDQRFNPSIPSVLGRRRTSADVTGRGSEKSKPLYPGLGRGG